MTSATSPENPLPAGVRQNVAHLALFVLNHTMVVLANPKPENLWNSGAVVCIEACICVCSAGIWAPGGFGMATGLTFADEPVFGNESDAMDYLEENCQKWEDAIAVKYKDGSSLVTP